MCDVTVGMLGGASMDVSRISVVKIHVVLSMGTSYAVPVLDGWAWPQVGTIMDTVNNGKVGGVHMQNT